MSPTISNASCCASIGMARHAQRGSADRRLLRFRPGRLLLLAVGTALRRQRKQHELLFPHALPRHARITITNEGKQPIGSLYYNIDYQTDSHPLPPGTLYFHAQYRQAQPNHGWTNQWTSNGDPLVNDKRNLNGQDNYVWMEAKGHGQFVGVTMSILQNQDGWWGGDDMFFVDDDATRDISGPVRRITSWARGISEASHSPISFMGRRWWARNWPAAGRASTVFILTLPFLSEIVQGHHRARKRQPSLRQFLLCRLLVSDGAHAAFPPCRRSTRGCRWCNRWEARGTPTRSATPPAGAHAPPVVRPSTPASIAVIARPQYFGPEGVYNQEGDGRAAFGEIRPVHLPPASVRGLGSG